MKKLLYSECIFLMICMYIYTCMYLYIYTYIYIYMYIHIYINKYKHIYIYIYIQVCVYIYICLYIYMCIYKYVCRERERWQIHPHAHIYIYQTAHSYTYIHGNLAGGVVWMNSKPLFVRPSKLDCTLVIFKFNDQKITPKTIVIKHCCLFRVIFSVFFWLLNLIITKILYYQ